MTESTVWWLLAGSSVALELLSGTFYLLMLAIGLAAAALAAQMGASLSAQFVTAAGVGGAAVIAWHLLRGRRPPDPPDAANPDLHLDVGETVQVEHWLPDGSASVRYRGTHWTVIHRPGVPPAPGAHRVAEVLGNRLLVDRL
jgi:membrane protein implicated in regulation of membrane protease activity